MNRAIDFLLNNKLPEEPNLFKKVKNKTGKMISVYIKGHALEILEKIQKENNITNSEIFNSLLLNIEKKL